MTFITLCLNKRQEKYLVDKNVFILHEVISISINYIIIFYIRTMP